LSDANPNRRPRVGEFTERDLRQYQETKRLQENQDVEDDPKWGMSRFVLGMALEIRVRDSNERFVFLYADVQDLIIGRYDPISGNSPDIDLESFGALNKGVSRQHAVISRRDGSLNLIDQGSPNGTLLNGQKLVMQQPRILRDGDDIRLGHLVVRVTFLNE